MLGACSRCVLSQCLACDSPRSNSIGPPAQGEGEEAEALVSEALVEVRAGGGAAVLGRLDAAHLADHPAAVAALRACLAVRIRACASVVLDCGALYKCEQRMHWSRSRALRQKKLYCMGWNGSLCL